MNRQTRSMADVQFGSRDVGLMERNVRPTAVAPADRAELPMLIQFEGLTLAEQRTALAAFPGGKRFLLLS